MPNTTAAVAISLVIISTTLRAQPEKPTDDRPAVFVHIENQAAAPPETISAARDELAHIYDAIGVRIESSAEPDHSRCGLRLTVHVLLLAGATADRYIKSERVTPKVLARANSEARRVYVLWDRLGPSVDHQAIDHGDALGLVIAHELGHVLLPARTHSENGLMEPHYDVYRSYGLKFTPEESAAMRAFIGAAERNARIRRP